MRQEFNLFIGSALFIAGVFFVGTGVGAIAGLNAPDGAVCAQTNLPCQLFRLRNPKTVI